MFAKKVLSVICLCLCISAVVNSQEWQQDPIHTLMGSQNFPMQQNVDTVYADVRGTPKLVHTGNTEVMGISQSIPLVNPSYESYGQNTWMQSTASPFVTPYSNLIQNVVHPVFPITVNNEVLETIGKDLESVYSSNTFPEIMLQMHNEIRARAGVQPIQWSHELEAFAKRNTMLEDVNECKAQETPIELRQAVGGFRNVGENSYANLGPMTVHKLVDSVRSWISGMKCYNFGPLGDQCTLKQTPECKQSSKVVKQFVQLLAVPVTHIGCSVHRCSSCMYSENCLQGHVITCNYGSTVVPHAGNVVGMLPFDDNVAKRLGLGNCFIPINSASFTPSKAVLSVFNEMLDNIEVQYKLRVSPMHYSNTANTVYGSYPRLSKFLTRGTFLNNMIKSTPVEPMQTFFNQMKTLPTMQSIVNPMQSMQSIVNPMQSMQSIVNPMQSMQSIVNPMQSIVNPMQSIVNPMQSIVNPMQSIVSPLQTMQAYKQTVNPMRRISTALYNGNSMINKYDDVNDMIVRDTMYNRDRSTVPTVLSTSPSMIDYLMVQYPYNQYTTNVSYSYPQNLYEALRGQRSRVETATPYMQYQYPLNQYVNQLPTNENSLFDGLPAIQSGPNQYMYQTPRMYANAYNGKNKCC